MDDTKEKAVRPFEPSFVSAVGIAAAAAVLAVSYFALGSAELPLASRIAVAVALAGVAEVSASNLRYALVLRRGKDRLFLPEINDVPAVVTRDIGGKRRRGGEVSFEYMGRKALAPAITMDADGFAAGERVHVICADSDGLLLVEKE